jgi:5-methylcytosine-specific restriction protein A
MTHQAPHPCNSPSCHRLVWSGMYCAEHVAKQQQSNRDRDRRRMAKKDTAQAARIRSSAAWQRVRRLQLARNPLCCDPFNNHQRTGNTVTGTQVHHIVGLSVRPDLALHMDNLVSVCTKCHSQLERKASMEPAPPHIGGKG